MRSRGKGWKREKKKYEKVIMPEDHLNSITKNVWLMLNL
jgi:hypothetical protein